MARIAKWHGPTVNLYLEGTGGESTLDLYCEHNDGTAYKCPYAVGYINPLPEGEMCQEKRDGQCPRLAAQLDALKRAKSAIASRMKEIEEEMDGGD